MTHSDMLAEMDARLKGAVAQRNAHKEHDHASITMGAKVDVWEQAIEIAHKYAPVASGEDVERVIEAIYYHDDVTITTDAARAAIAAMSRTSLGDAAIRKDAGCTGTTDTATSASVVRASPASPSGGSPLLPCPFCGGDAELEEWRKSNYVTENGHKCPECWFIGCQAGMGCPGFSRALHMTKEAAIAWWQPRTAEPAINEEAFKYAWDKANGSWLYEKVTRQIIIDYLIALNTNHGAGR